MDSLIKTPGKKVFGKKRTLMFLNLNISCIATSMLGTALTTSLPPILRDLKVSVDTGQWLTSGFGLFLAIMTPFTGYLISRFKTKRLYCIAIAFFIIGLTICAFSRSIYIMMIGRIIQGCGNGLLSSMGQVIILTVYPPDRIGTMMGWYGLSMGVAPILAPTIAGILVDTVGWRMIFVIAIAIMTISFIFAIFVFEDVLPTMRKKFDFISLIISALAFGGVTFAIGNMGTHEFVSYHVLFSLIVGVVSGIIFTYRQLHLKVPFLDVRIMKNKDYSVSLAATVILNLILMGTAIVFPVYVQNIKGHSATISGLNALPGSLAMAIISPFAGRIYDKIGMKLLFIIGSVVSTASNLSIYFIPYKMSIWYVGFIGILRMASIGALLMPLVTWAMKDVPKVKASDATALFNSIRFIGGACGSALFISIMTKIANTLGKNKEHPDMYGFNFVALIMGVFSFICLLLGLFGCKHTVKKTKTEENTEDMIKQDNKLEMRTKDQPDVEIVVGNKENENTGSESETVIENEISIDELSINKEKYENETVLDNEIGKETTINKVNSNN